MLNTFLEANNWNAITLFLSLLKNSPAPLRITTRTAVNYSEILCQVLIKILLCFSTINIVPKYATFTTSLQQRNKMHDNLSMLKLVIKYTPVPGDHKVWFRSTRRNISYQTAHRSLLYNRRTYLLFVCFHTCSCNDVQILLKFIK